MASSGECLDGVPDQNLLSILFLQNRLDDDFVLWRNAQDEKQKITKRLARELVCNLAHGYVSAGIIESGKRAPDKIIVVSENQVIGFPNVLAFLAAGCIIATCPWQASLQELLFRIRILQPKAVICSRASLPLVLSSRKSSKYWFAIIVQDSATMTVESEDGKSYISPEMFVWDKEWNQEITNRPAFVVFSSGTTGSPKGVCISQKNIISMIFQLKHLFSRVKAETTTWKMAGILDSAHVAGLFINTMIPLGLGVENVIVPATDIDLLLRVFDRHSIDLLFGVPAVLTRMIAHPRFKSTNFKDLKFTGCGAAKTPVEVQQEFTQELSPGTFCQEAWGMTELTFLATMHTPGVRGPWQSVGKPLAANKVEVRDEDGNLVPVGEEGEIYVAGPTVTPGYYLAELKDHEAKQYSWLRTGDLGKVDQDGYVYITGRNKDLIKYHGNQVSPHELESIIRKHGSVLDVAVVGTQLDDGNELPTAFVVLAEKQPHNITAEIQQFTDKQVSPYKKLRGGVHVIELIPKNPMGKIQYKDLKVTAKELHISVNKKSVLKL